MENVLRTTLLVLTLIIFSSCGINNALVVNQNQNNTQVHLTTNNYKVVDKVSGSAEVNYVLFIGGMNRKQLYENAYADMVNKADLMTGSKALINIITEEYVGGVPPFYYTRTITVSAHVVEFMR